MNMHAFKSAPVRLILKNSGKSDLVMDIEKVYTDGRCLLSVSGSPLPLSKTEAFESRSS